MRTMLPGNLFTIGMMGVLLLLAAAVGRATATSMTHWLAALHPPALRMSVDAPAGIDLAAMTEWRTR